MKTIEELLARQGEIKSRLAEIDKEFAGQALPDASRSEWNTLNEEREANDKLVGELRARKDLVAGLDADPASREEGAAFHTARPGAARGDDIYDLSTVRMNAASPEDATRELRDRAMRSLETATFAHDRATNYRGFQDECKEHVSWLLDMRDSRDGELARRILTTGSPTYKRAFDKYLRGAPLSNDESRALSIGTGSGGGFAIVYTLDPTIIPTSNLSVNPYRRIANVDQIVGTNEWRGVTSAGVSAAYAAEGTEASDNAPTLVQPALIVNKAQCFVPFSIELDQDWSGLQSSMAALIQDAKDDLEAVQFTTGTGTPPAPSGVLTGATTTVTTAGVAAFAISDLYKTEEALGPRFRPRAQWLGNRFAYNKARQFDTAGGSGVWAVNNQAGGQLQAGLASDVPHGGNLNGELIGYPANEVSAMAAALTTGSKILALGDFSYFKIVDRIGLSIEIAPMLFGATNRFPTGQRGMYAYWRNNSKVLDPNAFRVLVTQ